MRSFVNLLSWERTRAWDSCWMVVDMNYSLCSPLNSFYGLEQYEYDVEDQCLAAESGFCFEPIQFIGDFFLLEQFV